MVLQSAISVLATILAFRLARTLQLGVPASAFVALAHTTSILLLFDLNILVDRLFANGLFIAAALLALGILSGRRPGYLSVLGIGAILIVPFLMRETTIYFLPFWALGSIIWARCAGMRWNRAFLCFVVAALPALSLRLSIANGIAPVWAKHC